LISISKNIRRPELTEKLVGFFFTSRKNKSRWINGLNWIFKNKDWSECDGFRYDYDDDMERYGVYYKLSNIELWSWRNSIETNQSSIFEIINELNLGLNEGDQITFQTLKDDFESSSSKLLKYIYYNFDYVFGSKGVTKLSRRLQIITSNTWYSSKFSEMTYIRVFHQNEQVFIPKNRGNGDDYKRGIDFVIGSKRYQHKRTSVIESEDTIEVISNNLYKSKHVSVDVLVVQYGVHIYELDITNIYDEKIISTSNSLIIPSDRLIKKRDVVEDELTDLLFKLFKVCLGNEFIFEMIDSDDSSVELNISDKTMIIKFPGVDLESIESELRVSLEKLIDVLN